MKIKYRNTPNMHRCWSTRIFGRLIVFTVWRKSK